MKANHIYYQIIQSKHYQIIQSKLYTFSTPKEYTNVNWTNEKSFNKNLNIVQLPKYM